jgi:hypothetical protein
MYQRNEKRNQKSEFRNKNPRNHLNLLYWQQPKLPSKNVILILAYDNNLYWMKNNLFFLLLFILFYLQVGAVKARQAPPDWCFFWSRDPHIWTFHCIAFTKTIPWQLGDSDFHNLKGFTSKKMPNNILKNVCFKSVDLIGKKFTHKSYLQKTFASY